MPVDFTLDPELVALRDRVRAFVRDEVLPREADAVDREADRLDPKVLDELRAQARDSDLWAPHMPEAWGGLGVGPVGMAVLHEELGYSPLGALALNCMAPDEGNMHTLLEFGSEAQKERFLRPLVAGDVRSCFAMTEPGGAGADATAIETTAEPADDGDGWVLNGRKWFVTGADGAGFALVMARTDPDEERHLAASIFLVDLTEGGDGGGDGDGGGGEPGDGPDGWTIVRRIPVMGSPFPGGHCEIALDDLRVPDDAMVGGRGMGFLVAQERLGMGRIAHAMRWIGTGQRALDLAAGRALDRETFGKPLAKRQAVRWMLADSARDLYLSRLMVLHAAWKIEQDLEHRQEISQVKVFVANALNRVVDRAVQVHGGQGVSHDTPLAAFYQDARSARIYDGPDEVHQHVVARTVLEAMREHGETRSAAEVLEDGR